MYRHTNAYAPKSIQTQLQKEDIGRVLMVHSKGVYLQFGEESLLLCDAIWETIPIGISMQNFSDMVTAFGIRERQKVGMDKGSLRFEQGILDITFLPEQISCIPGDRLPDRRCILQAATELRNRKKRGGISLLVNPLILGEEADPCMDADPYYRQAEARLRELIQTFDKIIAPRREFMVVGASTATETEIMGIGISTNISTDTSISTNTEVEFTDFATYRSSDWELTGSVHRLLGLGRGLTPSCDDVLVGMLYVFHRISGRLLEENGSKMREASNVMMAKSFSGKGRKPLEHAVRIFRQAIRELAPGNTNQVSCSFLHAVERDESFTRMNQFWLALCGETPMNIDTLLCIGNQSGSEMLLGMLIALQICGYGIKKPE